MEIPYDALEIVGFISLGVLITLGALSFWRFVKPVKEDPQVRLLQKLNDYLASALDNERARTQKLVDELLLLKMASAHADYSLPVKALADRVRQVAGIAGPGPNDLDMAIPVPDGEPYQLAYGVESSFGGPF